MQSDQITLIPAIEALTGEMTSWRRWLHAHPELRFEEEATANFVAKKLAEFGVEVGRGLARTGVVGRLKGRAQGSRSIALRADMDALPMSEHNHFAHCSTNPGRMHACGHDGHTATLLGAAKYLAETRNFAGEVYFIFQPGEEGGAGGRVMIEEGLFDQYPADEVYALHNMPGMPFGVFGGCTGGMMASADKIEIIVRGRGGHAAQPHRTIDPIMIGSQIVSALQSVVSRNIDPTSSVVVSITEFHAGSAINVIADEAILRGTVRCLSEDARKTAEQRVREISTGIATSFGGTSEVTWTPVYPTLVNHAAQLRKALDAAAAVVPPAQVDSDIDPTMGAEDFAYMLAAKPGAYLFLGAGDAGSNGNLHGPSYDFNDDLLTIGASFWARLVETELAISGPSWSGSAADARTA